MHMIWRRTSTPACLPRACPGWGALVSYRPLAAQVAKVLMRAAEAVTGHTYTYIAMQNAAHARYAPRTTAAYKVSRAAGRVEAGGIKKDSPYM